MNVSVQCKHVSSESQRPLGDDYVLCSSFLGYYCPDKVNLRKVAMAYLYKWLSFLELLQLYEVEACVNYHQVSDAVSRGR